MTEKEKMLAGEMYMPYDPQLVEERNHAREVTFQFNHSDSPDRCGLLRKLFGRTGEKVHVSPVFWCDYGSNIYVGENFYMNNNCIILDVCEVHIGDNCLIGPMVGIYTATHPLDAIQRREAKEYALPITVGNDVWIGGGVTVLPGVTIGSNCVIGAGSVVVHDIPDNSVAVGNPCKVIKTLDPIAEH